MLCVSWRSWGGRTGKSLRLNCRRGCTYAYNYDNIILAPGKTSESSFPGTLGFRAYSFCVYRSRFPPSRGARPCVPARRAAILCAFQYRIISAVIACPYRWVPAIITRLCSPLYRFIIVIARCGSAHQNIYYYVLDVLLSLRADIFRSTDYPVTGRPSSTQFCWAGLYCRNEEVAQRWFNRGKFFGK